MPCPAREHRVPACCTARQSNLYRCLIVGYMVTRHNVMLLAWSYNLTQGCNAYCDRLITTKRTTTLARALTPFACSGLLKELIRCRQELSLSCVQRCPYGTARMFIATGGLHEDAGNVLRRFTTPCETNCEFSFKLKLRVISLYSITVRRSWLQAR